MTIVAVDVVIQQAVPQEAEQLEAARTQLHVEATRSDITRGELESITAHAAPAHPVSV